MATETPAPAATEKKKRASFTRTAKPIYAVVQQMNDDGSLSPVDTSKFVFKFERDTEKLLDLVVETGCKPVKLEIPTAAKPAAKA